MNRTAIIIIGLVVFLCLCVVLIAVGAGIYFLGQPNALANLGVATAAPTSRLPGLPPTQPTRQANPNPTRIPNSGPGNPPAFPTITGGGTCDDVEEYEDQGNIGHDHIRPGQSHPPYNSNPPTSGWHWADPQEWGIYNTPQVQEQLVHNLEHGGIVIQYNNLSNAELQRLLDFVRRTPRHIIVAPYPGLPQGVRVAFTAWTYLQVCDGVDLESLAEFIDEFRDEGPEYIP